ncbi:MAG: nuclear transport factor 2 family protein [Streptomyces sp.]|uniref:ester cyclase n=1 Tax=Streptomyces sp. TaxID=1931 RepID=UPI0025FC3CA5|nr:nuclear transport factor 2 family protein [Streptomyces sp.]MBW8793170.1 nuclear transport factor 2 family protein [Streptomyces sp.]
MNEQNAPSWVKKYVDACNRHDSQAVVDMMSEDIQVVDTAFGGTFKGKDAVKALIDGMDASLSSDYVFTLGKVVESGDSYSFEWVLSGTHDRANPDLGIPATGKWFECPGVTIGVRTDGLITENRDYWNLAGFLMQTGLLPPLG